MRSSYLRGLNMASFFVASKIIIFATVCVYVLSGNRLSASRVFMAVALYGAVRLTITLFFPCAIEKVSESFISIRRIQVNTPRQKICTNHSFVHNGLLFLKAFLLLDEVSTQLPGVTVSEKAECMVIVQDLICYWDKVSFTSVLLLC